MANRPGQQPATAKPSDAASLTPANNLTMPQADTYSLTGSSGAVSPEIDWLAKSAVPAGGTLLNERTDDVKGTRRKSPWVLVACNALVFVSSVCVMVLELTASRLIAKHVGSSLYTWTSVIGVVLAGITIGNFLGGWLADRARPSKLLGWLFLIASILCLSVLWLDGVVAEKGRPADWDWPTWVVWVVALVFFLPSMSLGTISPVVASLALQHSQKLGRTVGNVYAWGALGSIVGTFLTGFVLIDTLGTRAIVALTAGTLASMGFLSAVGQWAFRAAVLFGWLQLVIWIGLAAGVTDAGLGRVMSSLSRAVTIWRDPLDQRQAAVRWSQFGELLGRQMHEFGLILGLRDDSIGEYHDESNYSYINVAERTENGQRVAVLKLDKLIHSYFVPDDPTELNYDYEKVYAAVTEQAISEWDRTTTVSLRELQTEIEKQRLAEQAASTLKDESSAPSDLPLKGASNTSPLADPNLPDFLKQQPLPSLDEVCWQLPSFVEFDPDKRELSVHGGLTPERRDELLKKHPYKDYWRAVERLQALTRHGDWNDFGTVPLAQWPKDVKIPDELRHKVLYDHHLQCLNVYHRLDANDVQRLLRLGEIEAVTYRAAVDRLFRQSRKISTLFLGGGGFVFPRWIETLFPHEPLIHVAELDPGVKAAVQSKMGLPPDGQTRVQTTIGDARNFVDDRVRANSDALKLGRQPVLYDFVYGDAFNDFSVPWHLTTLEFSQKIASLLHPMEGIYQVNLIDIYPRTEFPAERLKPDGSSTCVEGGVPEILTQSVVKSEEWAGVSSPYEGLEVELARGDCSHRLAVRGVMSDLLRDRLLKLGKGRTGFEEAVQRLYADSRTRKTGRFLGSYVNTISRVFPFVYVFSSEVDMPHASRDTFVVVASKRKLELADLRQASSHWSGVPFASLETDASGKLQARGQMSEILANAFSMVLTDDFAPVDNLLGAVFDAR